MKMTDCTVNRRVTYSAYFGRGLKNGDIVQAPPEIARAADFLTPLDLSAEEAEKVTKTAEPEPEKEPEKKAGKPKSKNRRSKSADTSEE